MKSYQEIQPVDPAPDLLFNVLKHLSSHPDRSGYQMSMVETCVFLDTIAANLADNASREQSREIFAAKDAIKTRLLALPIS